MKKNNSVLIIALLLSLMGILAWGYQISRGLIVTNMNNLFSWGLYIATFAFFVGVAAGGLIVSSSVYLFNIEKLKPFTKIASLSAFACTLGAGIMIMPDLGRVERVYQLLLHPNFTSPLVWDVIVVTAYLVLTFLSVYVQLLPDWHKAGNGFLNGWSRKYTTQEITALSKKWAKRVSIVGLPVAILIHTVTALIFATQASRGWWNTAILPPDFIAVAVASGTALVMLISLLTIGRENFEEYRDAMKIFAGIIAGALVVHFFFVAMDLIVHGWWGEEKARETLGMVFGPYAPLYTVEIMLPLAVLLVFFSKKAAVGRPGLVIGSVLLFIGVFAHRLMLMFPTFNAVPLTVSIPGAGVEGWKYPIAAGKMADGLPVFIDSWSYVPTGIELMVTFLPFGLVLLVIVLATRRYPFKPKNELN